MYQEKTLTLKQLILIKNAVEKMRNTPAFVNKSSFDLRWRVSRLMIAIDTEMKAYVPLETEVIQKFTAPNGQVNSLRAQKELEVLQGRLVEVRLPEIPFSWLKNDEDATVTEEFMMAYSEFIVEAPAEKEEEKKKKVKP